MSEKKKILLGITGGIAAYKSLFLIRLFIKNNYQVKVVATRNALEFITPLSIETLSNNRLYADVFDSPDEYTTEHISITDDADVFVVAPATANSIGKFANGIADDALSTTFLAFNKTVFIARSMNTKMMEHYTVTKNINYLKSNGVHFIEPEVGDLACGYQGKGRMAEPEAIFEQVHNFFRGEQKFKGKKVLISAGPTHESIDPVRFIGNYSSGKMGFHLAEEFEKNGAEVVLIAGPVALKTPSNIRRINITTAEEMLNACKSEFLTADITIMAAAVADYKPAEVSLQKIKKSENHLELQLTKTTDILGTLGRMKKLNQFLVGFALETNNEKENALSKLHTKNLDFIVLNSLNDNGAGFAHNTNKITIMDKQGNITDYPLKSKKEVARDILLHIEKQMD